MSDSTAPPTPFSAEEATASDRASPADALAGDWSEGLRGPVRAHGVAKPTLLSLNGHRESSLAVVDAHELLQGMTDEEQPSHAPAFVSDAPPADLTPPSQAPALAALAPAVPADSPTAMSPEPAETVATVEVPRDAASAAPASAESQSEDSAPTPWSEPVVAAPDPPAMDWGLPIATPPADLPAGAPPAAIPASAPEESAQPWTAAPVEPPAPPDETWSSPPAAEAVDEWQPEMAPADFEEVRTPDATAPVAAADWSTLRTGADWVAAAPEAPADAWGAAPPAPAASEWNPAPSTPEPPWAAAAAAATPEWASPPEEPRPAPGPAPAWNAPAVGASALEQLESDPPEPEPGAAKELFGTVPSGGMLSGDNDDFGPAEDLASPEEVLRPVAVDHEDPDLPAALDEPARPKPRAQPLAAFRPPPSVALEVHGEHRVAVHTRGGRTLRGTMRDIDLSKSQFPLVPQGGGEAETIYHSEVKAIFFMLAAGEKSQGGDGAKVRVTFADGRVIEGIRDGADAKHGFFLVPLDAARTNTRRIYIARAATADIKDG